MKMTVNDIIMKLEKGELEAPPVLANFLVVLSASLFKANNLETEAEMKYLKKWSEIKEEDHTDKMTDALARQTEEYREYKQLKSAKECIIECIRSLKHKLKNLETEYREGQNYG